MNNKDILRLCINIKQRSNLRLESLQKELDRVGDIVTLVNFIEDFIKRSEQNDPKSRREFN